MNKNLSAFRLGALIVGFIFLYGPILSLIVYSFNRSRLVTVWGGFSTQWYGRLFENQQILDAAWLSLKVAAINATGAVILGTLAGTALARFGKFKGRINNYLSAEGFDLKSAEKEFTARQKADAQNPSR